MLSKEIEVLARSAANFSSGAVPLTYPGRIDLERALINSAAFVARAHFGFDVTSFSMSSRAVVESELSGTRGSDSRQRNAVLMAFELASVLAALVSLNPYVQKDFGATSRAGPAGRQFARRLSSYCELLKEISTIDSELEKIDGLPDRRIRTVRAD